MQCATVAVYISVACQIFRVSSSINGHGGHERRNTVNRSNRRLQPRQGVTALSRCRPCSTISSKHTRSYHLKQYLDIQQTTRKEVSLCINVVVGTTVCCWLSSCGSSSTATSITGMNIFFELHHAIIHNKRQVTYMTVPVGTW
jgi:hypothetical protein